MREKSAEEGIEIESIESIYEGFLHLVRYQLRFKKFAGDWSELVSRECIKKQSAVGVLLHDPDLDSLVLIEQVRVGALADKKSPWLLELVAGLVEDGEALEAVAQREVYEETGLKVNRFEKMVNYWVSPGCSNEHFTLFYAQVDASQAGGVFGLVDEHEDINVHVVPVAQAKEWLAQGEVNNASLLIALQWFFARFS